ncbi:unnamed protein product, partial [Ilex paraguariensis]
ANISVGPPTCPADIGSECGVGTGEWKGEFFSGIPKIKYEVKAILENENMRCMLDKLLHRHSMFFI